ncbi:MAG TPA: glycosyltransferase family 2 protein, partial [Verrucomicrobiaceae bacterium]
MNSTPPHPAPADEIDLTILIPCKNEEANILGTLDTVVAALRELEVSHEILVIDDGSSDRTSALISNFQRDHPGVPLRLHRNPVNFGLSRTYVNGAFMGRGKYFRLVCGDNVESKETMVAIFSQMGKAEIIIPYYESVPGKSATRMAVSKLYTWLVNLFSGYSIRYYNGGALHTRYNVLRWHPYSFGFGFQADFITRLLDEGATHLEICVKASHTVKAKADSVFKPR